MAEVEKPPSVGYLFEQMEQRWNPDRLQEKIKAFFSGNPVPTKPEQPFIPPLTEEIIAK